MASGIIPRFKRWLFGDISPERQGKRSKLKARSKKTLISVFIIAVGAIGFFTAFQKTIALQWKATAFGLIILIATSAGGSFVGFLFGLPRINKERKAFPPGVTPQTTSQNANIQDTNLKSNSNEKYLTNSNLEEISDWLTKIIVGVGLTQIGQVPDFILRVANKLNSDFNLEGGVTFAIAFICFGTIFGFFIGYLVTKLYLEDVFERKGGGKTNYI